MTAPIDLITATQDLVVALVRAQLPDDQKLTVRHTLDEDTRPPFHLVADIESENVGGKGEQAEMLLVDIQTVYRGDDRGELLAMMHQVRLATDDQERSVDGVIFRTEWVSGKISPPASDGVTFVGVTTLEIYAGPA